MEFFNMKWLRTARAPNEGQSVEMPTMPPHDASRTDNTHSDNTVRAPSGTDNNAENTNLSRERTAGSHNDSGTEEPTVNDNDPIHVLQNANKTVKRKLTPLRLFMITVNGTLGAGLYIRSGQILQLAGPVVAFLSFLVLGFLAWAVMQCITELLCLWPVPGALPLFVSKFVDKELGNAVAFAYWFTYTVGFSALVGLSASTASYWAEDDDNIAVTHITVYAVLPFALGIINTLEIGWYGLFEVVTGIIKLTMLAIIILALIYINFTSETASETRKYWKHPWDYNKDVATNFVPALIMTLSIAVFAYSGVEIIAASIMEARWPGQSNAPPDSEPTVGSENGHHHQDSLSTAKDRRRKNIITTIKAIAVCVPILTTIIYTFSGLLLSLALSRDNPRLEKPKGIEKRTIIPPQPMVTTSGDGVISVTTTTKVEITTTTVGSTNTTSEASEASTKEASPFILIAEYLDQDKSEGKSEEEEGESQGGSKAGAKDGSNNPLKHIFNAFILFTTVTCANTNLYVSSRTLFGIARNIDAPEGLLKYIAFFGKTDNDRVPQRAVWISALAFYWVPFLQIPGEFKFDGTLGWAVEILIRSGSISLIIVWTCQCLAYLRYYRCINEHKSALQNARLHPQGVSNEKESEYPYRNHWQPVLAWAALIGCLLILLFCNSAILWKTFYPLHFLSGYLPIVVFLLIWLGQKVLLRDPESQRPWFHKLEEPDVVNIITFLNRKRNESILQPETELPTSH